MITYTPITTTSSIVLTPNLPPIGSVIWLHGLGADGQDFVSMAKELNLPLHLPLRFIFPHAPLQPVTINNGYVMRAWFDIYSMQIDQRIDVTGIANSVKLVSQLIENEQNKGISSEKIILGGFSQGAVIALTTGLGHSQKLGGIVALSGFLPNAQEVFSKKHQSIPVFLAHGTEDAIVPFILGKTTATILEKQGIPISFHSYSMPHSVCVQEINDISQWLIKQIT